MTQAARNVVAVDPVSGLIDNIVQDRGNSGELAIELLHSCAKPLPMA